MPFFIIIIIIIIIIISIIINIIIPPNLYKFEITESEGPQHILLAP